jgi:hypothetical protein
MGLIFLISLFADSAGYYNTGFMKRQTKKCPALLAGNYNFSVDPADTLSFAITGWCVNSFDADYPSAFMSQAWVYAPGTPFSYTGVAFVNTTNSRSYSGTKSLYSFAKVTSGNNLSPTNTRLATNEIYTTPQFAGGTTQFYIWLSSVSFTTSSRWSYSVSALITDGILLQNTVLACQAWGNQEGCLGNSQNNSDTTVIGSDGQSWYRYTVTIPGGMNLSNLQLKIRHTQDAWDGTGAQSSIYIGYVGP